MVQPLIKVNDVVYAISSTFLRLWIPRYLGAGGGEWVWGML